ncbi:hypothetical protein C3L33_03473, partial [Rhododendron williamsianum]
MGSCSIPNGLLSLSLAACLLVHLFPFGSAYPKDPPAISYHNGPLLTGNVSLALLWYGEFLPVEKTVVRTFIESLGMEKSMSFQSDVHSWWQKVHSYLELAEKKKSKGAVRIAREVDDEKASLGRVLGNESLPGKQVYIVVGNLEEECPGSCAVPFHRSRNPFMPPTAVTLEPPSGNLGADAMVIHFASALADTVTNPFGNGFFGTEWGQDSQAATLCMGLFATGAFPGYPGNVRVDPYTGGAFNARGLNDSKFLLPALWDPKTDDCWTVL